MRSILTLLTVSSFAAVSLAANVWPNTAPASGKSFRVSGTQSPASPSGDLWLFDQFYTESPLPVGYVAPTPVDAIEVKTYPSVRRAEISSTDIYWSDFDGQGRAFWALFDHIKARNIPMTAPVEFDFTNAKESGKFLAVPTSDWKMSFDYRTPNLGPTGNAENSVKVVDRPEGTVISIGFNGVFSWINLSNSISELRQALST